MVVRQLYSDPLSNQRGRDSESGLDKGESMTV